MSEQKYVELFNSMHHGFFQRDYIRSLRDDILFDEMLLPLDAFDASCYEKSLENITFGYFEGDFEEFLKLVEEVDSGWAEIFSKEQRIYCGYINGDIASFCIIEDMGTHKLGEITCKIGGPGCVGTVPRYRNKGIGLSLVKNVTQILKDEGYDYSYIHYTAVPRWYERLGYKTILRWSGSGIK